MLPARAMTDSVAHVDPGTVPVILFSGETIGRWTARFGSSMPGSPLHDTEAVGGCVLRDLLWQDLHLADKSF